MTLISTLESSFQIFFNKYNILNEVNKNQLFYIDLENISENIDSTLMLSIEHKNELPSVFTRNSLSFLPISCTEIVVGRFDLFEKVNYSNGLNPTPVSFITSLYHTEDPVLSTNFSLQEKSLMSGMYHQLLDIPVSIEMQTIGTDLIESEDLDFTLLLGESNPRLIKAKGPIYKNFLVYETLNEILLILSSNKKIGDFNIGHMFYPYKLLKKNTNKEIKPILLTKNDVLFSLFLYQFIDDSCINSIQLVKQQDFIIDTLNILRSDVEKLAYSTVTREEDSNLPFPQADTFDNITTLLEYLLAGNLHKDKVLLLLKDIKTTRQTDYYTNSAIYLGLIEKQLVSGKGVYFSISNKGRKIMSLPEKEKNLYIIQSIFEHSVFKRAFLEWFEKGLIHKDRVVEIMIEENLNLHSDSTLYRRAKTVISWIEWIISKIPN